MKNKKPKIEKPKPDKKTAMKKVQANPLVKKIRLDRVNAVSAEIKTNASLGFIIGEINITNKMSQHPPMPRRLPRQQRQHRFLRRV